MSSVRLLHSDLWSTITRLAKKSKRKYVAVAYLGSGAYKLLPMRRGDSLVVDMSDHAVSGGQTSPYEIQKYFDKGVDVYTHSKLHAKMFIFDNVVIVGSANASQRSKNVLEEAALLCRDREVLIRARGIIRGFQLERVTRELIRQRKRVYSPPGWPKRGDDREGEQSAYSRLWVLGLSTTEHVPTDEGKFLSSQMAKARGKIRNAKKHKANWARIPPRFARFNKQVAEGDLVITIVEDEGDTEVFPPYRVIRKEPYPSSIEDRRGWMSIYLEELKNPDTKTWPEFRSRAKKRYSRINKDSTREIRDEKTKEILLGMWP